MSENTRSKNERENETVALFTFLDSKTEREHKTVAFFSHFQTAKTSRNARGLLLSQF